MNKRHRRRPRSARFRPGPAKSGAQLRALDTPPRHRVRAELRAVQLTARSA